MGNFVQCLMDCSITSNCRKL